MKNIILVFVSFFIVGKVYAKGDWLTIKGLDISQISTQQLSVNLKVESPNLSYYNSFTTEIDGNIVTLKVCYTTTLATMPSNHDNNFEVNIPSATGNYMLIVKIYRANPGVCSYIDDGYLEDSASLDFTNPFSGTISLSTTDIENKDKMVKFYPNPVKDRLYFSEEISTVNITDFSGKIIKQFAVGGKSMDLSILTKGNYMIKIITKKGEIITKKLIKQ